jgi:hypothetical protein
MKIRMNYLVVAALLFGAAYANAAITDVIQFPTPQFVDPANPMGNYRYYDGDWGWTHNAIAGTITSASLLIGAWDVDYDGTSNGENDIIYAWKNGVKTELGLLGGGNNIWAYTTFNLDSSWFADINAGLQVFMDIDSTHNSLTWAVSLSKSVLSVDGGTIPNPEPTVPEPSTFIAGALLALPLGLRCFRNRKRVS